MDKKKLIEYTRWLLFEMEITPRNNKKVLKKIVNEFLKKNSNKDPDISEEIDEEFESLIPDENQSNISQTGSFLITYQIKELPNGKL